MIRVMSDILQKALNHYLALDPESKTRLIPLQGKIVTVELLGMGLIFQLVFSNHAIHLKWDDFAPPDTEIKGAPFSLLHMALNEKDRKQFFTEGVSIEGNLEVGEQVIDLFDRLEVDWEEYLSRGVGDIPAYQLGRAMKRIKRASQHICKTLLQNANEYVHEEMEVVPPREALQDFFAEVDTLRMDVDRLDQRVKGLLAQLGNS